ncbi:MAG: N-acetylmuramoyl-L-alanine amidase [Hominenteromicrobium sp.]
MSNSSFVNYTKISPYSNPRDHKIDKITIHHMAGNLSVESCGNVFSGTREASANYGVGTDGRVGMYVEEKNRSWASSNRDNDMRAVTIEVANDGGAPDWHVSDKALDKLIALCVDICRRNGIAALHYTGDKDGNLTRHNMFAATGCPGPYLESKFPYIAAEVNKCLNAGTAAEPDEPAVKQLYRVRKTWDDVKSQIGAFEVLDNAKAACKTGYKVFDSSGTVVYTPFEPYLFRITCDVLNIRSGPGTNYPVTGQIKDKLRYTIIEERTGTGSAKGWGRLKAGGWVAKDWIQKA